LRKGIRGICKNTKKQSNANRKESLSDQSLHFFPHQLILEHRQRCR
jgi:hypothetical protein